MMEGFGVHTFRFINKKGVSSFVKFHWKPLLGVHSVAWDEAQNISGKDPDFHRRDLWDAIESGQFPEWELGVQVIPEADEHKYEFDLLDPTKLVPEELVPVQRIGKLTLNRNPDNFFAETEQVAFHVGNVVPGIDFTNDPLMQGRLFSYTDTQLLRLGGPNFHEIPINRPVVPVYNNQRDGHMRQIINKGKTSYSPNTLGGGCPFQAGKMDGGFTSYPERIDAHKIRNRSKSFFDHFSQARLFFNSQSQPEKNHIIQALSFELGKVQTIEIRERMLRILSNIDMDMAKQIADALGMAVPKKGAPLNQSIPADGNPKDYQPIEVESSIISSAALSMANTIKNTIQTRKVAILAANGVNGNTLKKLQKALKDAGAMVDIIAPKQGYLISAEKDQIPVNGSFLTEASVFYDAVYVPGGAKSIETLEGDPDAIHFLNEAFKHCKPIAADTGSMPLLSATYFGSRLPTDNNKLLALGVVVSDKPQTLADQFIQVISQHRFWERESARKVPA
jgi:catalase